MKKLVLATLFLSLAGMALAAGVRVLDTPILGYGTPASVDVSTSTWTKLPTSQTVGRVAVYVDNPSANNAAVVAHIGDCSSTSIATTVRPIEILNGDNEGLYITLREDVCLWALSLHTSSETVHYQEIKK
jgi:hypothetical protein